MNIGVFGTTSEQIYMKIKLLSKTLPQENILKIQLSKNGENCRIEMIGGEHYIGMYTSERARGHKWKQAYIPYNIDLKILKCVILPSLISNLPKHEQIIGYWC